MIQMYRALFLLPLMMCGYSYAADDSIDWPQWRGPHRSGVITSEAPWPVSLNPEVLQEAWSIGLGPSYSTPIVKGNRVFTTETVDEKQEVIRAFDRTSGKQLWETAWEGALKVPFFAASNGSWIRSTPAVDEQFLYVAGIRDVLVCLDQQTGEVKWRTDFVKRFDTALPSFGCVCSPLIDGDRIYLQAGGGFVCVDKSTGEVVWRVLEDGGGMSGSAFSSPVMETVDGIRQVLVQTRTDLAGVDPQSGSVLWKQPVEAFRGMNILTPIVFENSIFTSSYGGGTVLLNPVRNDSGWQVEQLWRNKLQGYMSTPILLGDHVYLHQRNQRFASINLRTGKENWNTTPFGKYWSMVGNGQKILALDSDGELLLIEPNPEEFRLIDRRKISESPTWAHLVVVGDEVYVRALDRLTKYRWSQP